MHFENLKQPNHVRRGINTPFNFEAIQRVFTLQGIKELMGHNQLQKPGRKNLSSRIEGRTQGDQRVGSGGRLRCHMVEVDALGQDHRVQPLLQLQQLLILARLEAHLLHLECVDLD